MMIIFVLLLNLLANSTGSSFQSALEMTVPCLHYTQCVTAACNFITCHKEISTITIPITTKRGRAQSVARPACALCDFAFLTYLQTGYATATWRMTFNQRSAYISLSAVTIHANESPDLRGYWTKVYRICSRSNFSIDGVNATIRVAIRPPVAERQGRH